ncbi:MAG: T9SS type A sorting domain-containing protein [FCB group bacterium]|nr:T9SS type A sorting domain-containing protein [FCB group bacterium]
MKILLSALALALLVSFGHTTTIHVPGDSATIQAGIYGAANGDTVLVQPGTYTENISVSMNNIVLGSLFLTTGDTSYISQTIIDGDSSGPVVAFQSVGWDGATVISGFTIQNGLYTHGGGIHCDNAKPLISHNHIISNRSDARDEVAHGAGIFCESSDAMIIENEIRDNSSLGGTHNYAGGIYCEYSNPLIEGNVIENNSSQNVGGGICLLNSGGVIRSNTISGNRSRYGGAMSIGVFSDPTICFNIMYNNEAVGMGDGLDIFEYSSPVIINNVIANNNNHLGIYWDNSSPVIKNTIVWGNTVYGDGTPDITYCDIEGGYDGLGNIEIEPRFRDPENGDFHLMTTDCGSPYDSPCIDEGHPDDIDLVLNCQRGLGASIADMGAYGGNNELPLDIDEEGLPVPEYLFLRQNYPNPFNPITRISFSLPKACRAALEIYNITGQKVVTLVDKNLRAGTHEFAWDAGGVASGIYFYRLEADEYATTRKMILLK